MATRLHSQAAKRRWFFPWLSAAKTIGFPCGKQTTTLLAAGLGLPRSPVKGMTASRQTTCLRAPFRRAKLFTKDIKGGRARHAHSVIDLNPSVVCRVFRINGQGCFVVKLHRHAVGPFPLPLGKRQP